MRQQIREKRLATTQERYGVSNVGQTAHARQRHQDTYADTNRVQEINRRIHETKAARHGSAHYNNRDQARQTCQNRMGVDNPMQVPEIAKKSAHTRQQQWDPIGMLRANYERITANIRDQLELEVLTPPEHYTGVACRPEWLFRCVKCGNEFTQRFDYVSLPRCRSCYASEVRYQSQQELEILDFVKHNHDGIVISGDRSTIPPYEVDILIPDRNLAIECCGLYWHSEVSSGRGRLYLRRKMDQLQEKGFRLITVFSDEYESRPEVVRKTILTALNANQDTSLHARKCEIEEISSETARDFHEQNHIQGSTKSASSHWALTHQGEPVMVMSFRRTGTNQWELSRMSSSARVRGGATKLFGAWCRETGAQRVVTFADLRWSLGQVYEIMGFKQTGQVPPMQSYVIGYSQRVPKRTFAKARLVREGHDPNKSEWQILQDIGVDRIWDCGKIRWEWFKTPE